MKGFFVCQDHGDIYEEENPEGELRSASVKLLRDDVPRPVAGREIVCPLCSRPMTVEIRA